MNLNQNAPNPKQNMLKPANTTDKKQENTKASLLRTLLIISIIADVAALAASAVGGFGWQYLLPIGSLLAFSLIGLVTLLRGDLLPTNYSSFFVVCSNYLHYRNTTWLRVARYKYAGICRGN